jgi:hypothetical protein
MWTLSLAVAVAGVMGSAPGAAYGGADYDAGFAVAADEPGTLPEDPAYDPATANPFIEEELPIESGIESSVLPYAPGACGISCGPACGTCRPRSRRLCRGCGGCGGGLCCPGAPLPLFYSETMNRMGLKFGGWIDHGVSVVANSPADRYNGVVGFNDRDGEYQMNQLWTYLEKAINPNKFTDVGGRIDFLYGTDARFAQAVDGLEANWTQEEPFYQASLPQFYLDAAVGDWTFRIGHFLSLIGYEDVPAPSNYFYSHSYAFLYGEPKTQTGFLAMHDIGQLSLAAGLHRGFDQFDDTDGLNTLGYMGNVSFSTADNDFTTSFGVSATEQGPGVETLVYSLVGICHVTERLTWVLQHDYGRSTFGRGGSRAQWYGLNQYLLYEINCCLSAGLRVEWFTDEDGTRVAGLGQGNQACGPYIGDFYEVTFGLNWRPHGNILVRPEVRWDWFDTDVPGLAQPFDAGESDDQFLYGCDMVFLF